MQQMQMQMEMQITPTAALYITGGMRDVQYIQHARHNAVSRYTSAQLHPSPVCLCLCAYLISFLNRLLSTSKEIGGGRPRLVTGSRARTHTHTAVTYCRRQFVGSILNFIVVPLPSLLSSRGIYRIFYSSLIAITCLTLLPSSLLPTSANPSFPPRRTHHTPHTPSSLLPRLFASHLPISARRSPQPGNVRRTSPTAHSAFPHPATRPPPTRPKTLHATNRGGHPAATEWKATSKMRSCPPARLYSSPRPCVLPVPVQRSMDSTYCTLLLPHAATTHARRLQATHAHTHTHMLLHCTALHCRVEYCTHAPYIYTPSAVFLPPRISSPAPPR